jgi:hypothetical protein
MEINKPQGIDHRGFRAKPIDSTAVLYRQQVPVSFWSKITGRLKCPEK